MSRRDFDGKQRFSIRKLNIGVCSVLLSTLLLTMTQTHVAHADTTDNNEQQEEVETSSTKGAVASAQGKDTNSEPNKNQNNSQTDADQQQSSRLLSATQNSNLTAANSKAQIAHDDLQFADAHGNAITPTNATYKITASTDASASLSGSNQKVFDGSGVTTAQINNGGSIEVKFT